MRLSIEEMEKVISDFVGERVVFEGQDSHAIYFNSERSEYKLVIDQEEESLFEREHGKEDWQIVF